MRAITVVLLLSMAGLYGWFHVRFVVPHRDCAAIEQAIRSLALQRPDHVTRGQWGSAVAWTSNLHGNSLVFHEAEPAEIAAFRCRLEDELGKPVDMATIHWIWHEYASLTPHGEQYQRFKPQMLEEIATVGPDSDPWGMNVP